MHFRVSNFKSLFKERRKANLRFGAQTTRKKLLLANFRVARKTKTICATLFTFPLFYFRCSLCLAALITDCWLVRARWANLHLLLFCYVLFSFVHKVWLFLFAGRVCFGATFNLAVSLCVKARQCKTTQLQKSIFPPLFISVQVTNQLAKIVCREAKSAPLQIWFSLLACKTCYLRVALLAQRVEFRSARACLGKQQFALALLCVAVRCHLQGKQRSGKSGPNRNFAHLLPALCLSWQRKLQFCAREFVAFL